MRSFLPRLLCLVGILAAGSAALVVTATPGAFGGRGVIVITADFGVRS